MQASQMLSTPLKWRLLCKSNVNHRPALGTSQMAAQPKDFGGRGKAKADTVREDKGLQQAAGSLPMS